MINESILPEGFSPETPLFPTEEQEIEAAPEAAEDPIEAQNEAAAAKAPVRGICGGSHAMPGEVSDFERGFDAAYRW